MTKFDKNNQMTDAEKDAFIGGIELGIDWGFKDIPPEDIELYHQLIKERDQANTKFGQVAVKL